MQEIIDTYCWEDRKKLITQEQHKIDGLKNLAYWNYVTAAPPTPQHFHTDILEIHCLLKGKRVCTVGEDDYTITGNELFITYPFEPHCTSGYQASPCSFIAFQLDIHEKDHLLGLNPSYSRALHELLVGYKNRHVRFTNQDAQLLRLAFMNISDGNQLSLYLGVQYLSCFLFKVQDFIPVRKREKAIMDEHIKLVLHTIEKRYKDNPKLSELAALSGYSLSRFKGKFKEVVGIPPANYIALKKLEFAKELLSKTDYPITHIALEAGFSSSNYFCTMMKRSTSYSPSEFRDMCRKSQTDMA